MKIFVYKELEILASVDTKAIGRMGWLEARPLVNGHLSCTGLRSVGGKKTKLHLIQAIVLL